MLSYKNEEGSQKSGQLRLHQLASESLFQGEKDNEMILLSNQSTNQPMDPVAFAQYIYDQSFLLASDDVVQIRSAIINLSQNLSLYNNFVEKMYFCDEMLVAIQSGLISIESDQPDIELFEHSVNLLHILVMNSQITGNYFDCHIPLSIMACMEKEIPFVLCARLVEILVCLVQTNEPRAVLYMFREGIVTRICDLMSCFNPQKCPSREKEPIELLPYKSMGTEMEDYVIIYPLLLFTCNILRFISSDFDSYCHYNILNELVEHVNGLLFTNLSEESMSCAFYILRNLSEGKSQELFFDAFLKMRPLSVILDGAFSQNNHQKFALQIIQNIADMPEGYDILVDEKFLKRLFTTMQIDETDDVIIKRCLLILLNLSYYQDYNVKSRKRNRKILKMSVRKIYELDYLVDLHEKSSFEIKSLVGHIFANLLSADNIEISEEILCNYDVLSIFLPLMQSGNPKLVKNIAEVLLQIIDTFRESQDVLKICTDIKELGFLDEFDEANSGEYNCYLSVKALQNTIDSILQNYCNEEQQFPE